jgi:hypothetical protein
VTARCIAMGGWQDMWLAQCVLAETCHACLITSMVAASADTRQPQGVAWQRLMSPDETTAIANHSKGSSIGRHFDIDGLSGHVQQAALASPLALGIRTSGHALPTSTGPPAADAGTLPRPAHSPVQTPDIPSLWEFWLLDSIAPSWRKGFAGAFVYGSADTLAQVCSSL